MNKNITNVNHEQQLKEQIKNEIMDKFSQKDIDIYLRRELNIWGKIVIFGVYSIAIFFSGIYFYKSYTNNLLADGQLEKIHQEIKTYFIKEKELNALSYSIYGDNLAQKVEQNISRTIASQRNFRRELIQNKNLQITELKRNNIELKRQLELLIDSSLMISKSDKKNPKSLTYTKTNYAVLRKKHNLKEKELEDKINDLEQVFVSTHDMSDPKVQTLYKKLKQATELELYKLRQTNYQIQIDFKKNKYLTKNTK